MSENLRKDLGIDEWLELVKEDKNLNGAYISFGQYMHLLEQENQQLKEEINKISKKELKVRDMLYSIENGTLTRERLMQIEEVLFELGENNEQ